MQCVIIHEAQKGLLFKNGKFQRVLHAGKYYLFGGREIEAIPLEEPLVSRKCGQAALLENSPLVEMTVSHTVPVGQLAIHLVDGQFSGCLESGRYLFWREAGEHSFLPVDLSDPRPADDLPRALLDQIPPEYMRKVEVASHDVGRLFIDNRFVELLQPGTYYFWQGGPLVEVSAEDTRLQQMVIPGQEILTADKVSLRVNVVCSYRITDFVRIVTEIEDYRAQLHLTVQLALREYVGKIRLDDLLDNKEALAADVLARLKEKEAGMFLCVEDAGIRDIILPGEIRQIMNTVLMAEKQAQANVITRREEVASTRSLLNTAKLMEDNPTLYRLKQMEVLEKICSHLDSLHLNGNTDALSQLLSAVEMKGIS